MYLFMYNAMHIQNIAARTPTVHKPMSGAGRRERGEEEERDTVRTWFERRNKYQSQERV